VFFRSSSSTTRMLSLSFFLTHALSFTHTHTLAQTEQACSHLQSIARRAQSNFKINSLAHTHTLSSLHTHALSLTLTHLCTDAAGEFLRTRTLFLPYTHSLSLLHTLSLAQTEQETYRTPLQGVRKAIRK